MIGRNFGVIGEGFVKSKVKHEYLQSRAYMYMFVTFIIIIIIIIRVPFYQIMDYRDTRAFILDPCIQEF